MKGRWRGIYSLHTKSNRYTQFTNLGGTELRNSVGPITQTRWDRFALFGETEMLQKGNIEFTLQSRWDRSLISVRLKHYEGKQRDYNPISVRPRSLSVRPICLGFVAVAMTFKLGGAE